MPSPDRAPLTNFANCFADVVEEKDVCQWETFEAKCPPDSVIVMTSALYGRMAYGRCVKRDYGYVGCYKDVLQLADAHCSGLHQCNITIPSKEFDKAIAKTCPEDLRHYLRASYTCRKGAQSISKPYLPTCYLLIDVLSLASDTNCTLYVITVKLSNLQPFNLLCSRKKAQSFITTRAKSLPIKKGRAPEW